jgi:hypothetical protein
MQHPVIDENELVGREELLRLLEEASGRPLRSRAAVREYLDEVAQRHARKSKAAGRWRTAKAVTLATLGVLALLQYYFLDIMVQMVTMPQLTIFVRVAKVL